MAPLQRPSKSAMCETCETGIQNAPHANQYFDLTGGFNVIGGRPDERFGWQGGFTHGVTTMAGGVPHDIRPPAEVTNHGTVLFTSKTLKPDMSGALLIKPGTADERLGRSGVQARLRRPAPADATTAELNHGTVLAVCPNLKADMRAEGPTMNVIGGRPTERFGYRSYAPGQRIWAGGAPRDIAPPRDVQHGTVLAICPNLKPDMREEGPAIKPGTDGERLGRLGSFEHGDSHLHMPTRAEAELWKEAGQAKGARRFGQGHFLAGASVLEGGAVAYRGA